MTNNDRRSCTCHPSDNPPTPSASVSTPSGLGPIAPPPPPPPDVVTARLMIADAESVLGLERTMWELIRPQERQAP